jgi:hypothetical protein
MSHASKLVSLFRHGITNASEAMHIELATAISVIWGNDNADVDRAKHCSSCFQNGDMAAYEEIKKTLPYICFSGCFGYRNVTGLMPGTYNGLVVIDIDDIEETDEATAQERAAQLRDSLCGDPHIVACFLSPSGVGIKPVIATTEQDPAFHASAWATACKYLQGIGIDTSSSRGQADVTRACFIGYDPLAWINENATPLPVDYTLEIPQQNDQRKDPEKPTGALIKPSERHAYLCVYSARLAAMGMPEPEIRAAVDTLIATRFDLSDGRKFSHDEVSDAIAGAVRKYHHGDRSAISAIGQTAKAAMLSEYVGEIEEEDAPATIQLRSHADRIRETLTPPPELVPDMLPRGGIGAIIGLPGSGKSLVSCDLARAIAEGGEFAGRQCQQGKVAYICTDAPDSTERRMLLFSQQASENIMTITVAPRIPAGLPDLEIALSSVPDIALVVLDTWDSMRSHAAGGYSDQDASAEAIMSELRNISKARGLTFLIVHHSTKGDNKSARGTLVFDARCDWIGTIVREENTNNIMLETTKARDGSRGQVGAWKIESKAHEDAPDAKPIPYLRLLTQVESKAENGIAKVSKKEHTLQLVLQYIAAGPKPVRELCSQFSISPKTVVAVMKELRQRGHLKEDSMLLTEQGVRAADELSEVKQ